MKQILTDCVNRSSKFGRLGKYHTEVHCARSGAVLILGGIMLNVWAAALLFQPVEVHMVKKFKEVEEDEDAPQVS